jgi:hypothetical protein
MPTQEWLLIVFGWCRQARRTGYGKLGKSQQSGKRGEDFWLSGRNPGRQVLVTVYQARRLNVEAVFYPKSNFQAHALNPANKGSGGHFLFL